MMVLQMALTQTEAKSQPDRTVAPGGSHLISSLSPEGGLLHL